MPAHGADVQTIRTRRLLQQPGSPQITRNAALTLANGAITAVEADPAGSATDFPDTLIMPALANAHDHGRGVKTTAYGAFDAAVEAWVQATYTLPRLDPYLVAALAFARMAKAGITSVVHCHLSSDPATLRAAAADVARAARDVGVRVGFVVPLRDRHRLGYGPDDAILAHMPADDVEVIRARWLRPIPAISEQLATVEDIARACESDGFSVQYGPVGMEWCSDALLAEVAREADASGRRIHMHLLESKYQRRWADREYPEGPVRRLETLGLLSDRLTLAHGVWLRPDEASMLGRAGATVSVNPSSNLRLKSGVASLEMMKAAGLRFAIGLDSLGLDDDDDMLRELRLAALLNGSVGFDAPIGRTDVLDAGCRNGACAVCGERGAGQLAAGAPADFIVLDYAALAFDIPESLDDPLSTLFVRARASHIAAVYAGGRQIVRDGRVLGIDEDAVQRALFAELETAAVDIAALRPLLTRFQQGLARYCTQG